MFKIRVECFLDKCIEEVFDGIADHENYYRFPGVDRSTLIEPGTNEKNGAGALRIIVAGQIQLTERITEFQRPTKMHYQIERSSPFRIRHDKGEITLQAFDGKTRVLWVSEGHLRVPVIGSLLDRIVERRISNAFRNMLNYIGRH